MATIASHHGDLNPSKDLTPQGALRHAWYTYLILLATPFVVSLIAIWRLSGEGLTRPDIPVGNFWFISAVAFVVIAGPAAFFYRSRLFRDYWKGNCVPPVAYLRGMRIVWGVLELAGLYALAGAFVTRSLLPNMLPAIVAFMMFVVLWPSGRAMVCEGRGDSDDPERYEEPR
jgi:hypothetical protein